MEPSTMDDVLEVSGIDEPSPRRPRRQRGGGAAGLHQPHKHTIMTWSWKSLILHKGSPIMLVTMEKPFPAPISQLLSSFSMASMSRSRSYSLIETSLFAMAMAVQ
uniref:Uncharacterized protein n=1 Tax=Oryza glumipatula TaxID=40148 RepID=A0A0E0BU30_9ORYZ